MLLDLNSELNNFVELQQEQTDPVSVQSNTDLLSLI